MRTLACLIFLASTALSDEVELKSGRVVTGKVIDLGDSIRLVKSGASIVYPKFMIRNIVYKKTVEEIYADQAKEIKKGDVAAHLKLAKWCLDRKLSKEAAKEYAKVIAVDPEHEAARKALKHRKHQGKWLTLEEYNKAIGLVKHKGRWMNPAQRDLEIALEEKEKLDKELVKRVDSLLRIVRHSNEKKRQEAIDSLSKFDDVYKTKAYVGGIRSSYVRIREFVYGELGRMKEAQAVKPLVRASLWDKKEELRDAAFQALQAINHPDTGLHYLKFLGEASVSARIRTLDRMRRFPDARVVPTLIQVLANVHNRLKQEEAYSTGQAQRVITRQVIITGGRTVVVPRVRYIKPQLSDPALIGKLQEEKASIVGLLGTITGEGHGDDPAAWARALNRKKTGKE